jgi:hypothetical protein
MRRLRYKDHNIFTKGKGSEGSRLKENNEAVFVKGPYDD